LKHLKTTAAASECDLVCRTAFYRWGDWRN